MKQLIIAAISSVLMACKLNCLEMSEASVSSSTGKSVIPKINCSSYSDSYPAIFVKVPQACTTKLLAAPSHCCSALFPLIYDPISITDEEPVVTSPRVREYY